MNKYIVAELRPCTDADQYTDIVINDGHFIIHRLDACKDGKTAMCVTVDIEHTQPSHSHITLHHGSLLKLLNGIAGEYEPQAEREIFNILVQAEKMGLSDE